MAACTARFTRIHPRIGEILAIRGISRIAGEGAVEDLVRLLRDKSPSVFREAKRQLEDHKSRVPGESLFAIVSESNLEHVKQQVVRLLFEKGKWPSLPWLIRIAFQSEGPTASLSRQLIEAWFSPPLCNRVFTKPSAAEKHAIDKAIDESPRLYGAEFLARLREWLRAI